MSRLRALWSARKPWVVLSWAFDPSRPVAVRSGHYWAWSAHLWSRLRPEPIRAAGIIYVVERRVL